MPDLSTQLREYFDATASPIEVEQVIRDDVWVPARQTPPKRSTTAGWTYGVAATVAVLVIIFGVALLLPSGNGNEVADTTPSTGSESSFQGTWVSTDANGGSPTATFQVSIDGVVEMVVLDDSASVCSGAPSTMTGTGRLETDTVVVIPEPTFACDDGSEPQALSGPPLHEQLQNLTFTHDPETDVILDNLGRSWIRDGAEPTATGWWPQSNPEELREAQKRADAGDLDYIWQLDTTLATDGDPWGAEILARFIEDELGWEAWEAAAFDGWLSADGGRYEQVTFIRCAPGETNPLSQVYAEVPPEIRGCAPTIDELSYETVGISVSQPDLRGPSGLWVVTRWETLQPKSPDSLRELLSPDLLAGRQVEQVVPPSDTELAALLEGFLQARVDGAGAEQYLLHEPEEWIFEDVPLLYATTSGALFERFEIEPVQGPRWPTGRILVRVRLFAEGGTVVEQLFHVVRIDGNLGLVYGYFDGALQSTENGQSVNIILDGEVTFATAPPWRRALGDPSDASDTHIRLQADREEFVVIGTDPLPGGADCENASTPADAEALARSIMADANSETTGTVPVRIAGLDGLQMDVDVNHNPYPCWRWWGPDQLAQWRTRLYLLDYPGDSAQILIIAVIAPAIDLERVIEEAKPIVESLEIHAP
jgi:hypothetical protein